MPVQQSVPISTGKLKEIFVMYGLNFLVRTKGEYEKSGNKNNLFRHYFPAFDWMSPVPLAKWQVH